MDVIPMAAVAVLWALVAGMAVALDRLGRPAPFHPGARS